MTIKGRASNIFQLNHLAGEHVDLFENANIFAVPSTISATRQIDPIEFTVTWREPVSWCGKMEFHLKSEEEIACSQFRQIGSN